MSVRPVPPWPSLYNFIIEIEPIEHRAPEQARGFYLHDPSGKCIVVYDSMTSHLLPRYIPIHLVLDPNILHAGIHILWDLRLP